MATANHYSFDGATQSTVQLPDEWFGAPVNKSALYQAMRAQQANRRAGTASTKTRREVRGGGAKPWRQKGTGRARAGTIRSPLWTGGGVTFGPKPKQWLERVPRRVRRLAFASSLTEKAATDSVRVVTLEAFDEPKTARLVRALEGWGASEGSTLILTAAVDENLFLSGRNVPRLTIKKFADASALDVLGHATVVIEEGAWNTRLSSSEAETKPEPAVEAVPEVAEEPAEEAVAEGIGVMEEVDG